MSESVNEKMSSTHSLTNSSTHPPSSEIAIRVDHVSKKFCRYLRKSMLYGMHDIGRNLLRMSTKPDRLRKHEFWAVDDVSFELHRGETLGIIGPNGSGKSTILKMLNGIFMPDKGKIEINGRVGALIEIGAGFHPLLTGRENISVNGAILGMSKEEIDDKFDDIVEFADIGDFLDTPVKHYSSGMYVRLGFAVAVHCHPEILLVDEVLSVGDAGFRGRCAKKMNDIKKEGTTVVFVSHDMNAVMHICDKVLWLENGHIVNAGEPRDIVLSYLDNVEKASMLMAREPFSDAISANTPIKIDKIILVDEEGRETYEFGYNDDLRVHIHYLADKNVSRAYFAVLVGTVSGECLFLAHMRSDGNAPIKVANKGVVKCKFNSVPLLPNTYMVGIAVIAEDGATPYIYTTWLKKFRIKRIKDEGMIPVGAGSQYPPFTFVPYEWEMPGEDIQ
jgi:lipopolysaccharide transport system ATP-binding protein